MTTTRPPGRSEPAPGETVSRAWVQVTVLVLLGGLAVLGYLGYRAYAADPPIAGKVGTASGEVLFTGADVIAGQKLFCARV